LDQKTAPKALEKEDDDMQKSGMYPANYRHHGFPSRSHLFS